MKISHKLCVRMDGTQFLWIWWFTVKNDPPQTYRQCTRCAKLDETSGVHPLPKTLHYAKHHYCWLNIIHLFLLSFCKKVRKFWKQFMVFSTLPKNNRRNEKKPVFFFGFLGRIENTIICFQDFKTFSGNNLN